MDTKVTELPAQSHDPMFLDGVVPRYDSVASAQRAKSQLDGADIYAGCCTLKIEYAKVSCDC